MKKHGIRKQTLFRQRSQTLFVVARNRRNRKLPPVPVPDTGIPGIRHLLSGRYSPAGRVIWSVALILCLAAWIHQSLHLIKLFNSEPVSVELSMRTNGSLLFPHLTLCPYKPLVYSHEFVRTIQQANSNLGLDLKNLEELWHHLPQLERNVSSLWDIGQIRPMDIVVNEICGIDKSPCGYRIEKKPVKTFIGTCLTIYIAPPSLIEYFGPSTGVDLVVTDNRSFVDKILKISTQERGYTLYLHDSETDPIFDAFFQGSIIRHSSITTLSLNMKQFQFKNTSSRPCYDGRSVSKCEVACITSNIIAGTRCRLPFIKTRLRPPCESTDSFNESFFRPQSIYRSLGSSACPCPQRCLNTVYVSDSDVSRGLTNKTEIRVYMKDRRFELLYERSAYSLAEVMGDLGGLFGVFLGACLLSFLELAEMAIFYGRVVHRRWVHRGWC